MTSTTEEPKILKVDRRGRVHVPAARREALLDEYERSGASAPEFARLVGIGYGTFAGWWAQRRRARAVQVEPAPCTVQKEQTVRAAVPFFAEVVETPAAVVEESGLAVELPGGGRLLITTASHVRWAAELLRLLSTTGGRSC